MISVIITTYKREPALIVRAINSVLNQTYRDIEIIVVDDSPADYLLRNDVERAVYECQKDDEGIHISYIQHERNRGACAARNTGIDLAKGEYIAFLDDDDEWLPEKLEKQIQVMLSKDVALVYCGRICKNDITGESVVEKTFYCKGDIFTQLLYSNFVGSTSFPLLKSDCLKQIGGFDEKMLSAQDYDVWLRIAEKYQIDYVAEPLVIYHEHDGEQITTNPIKKISGLERLNAKYEDYLEHNRNLWHRRKINITPFYAMAGDKGKAFHLWLACVRKCPEKIIENLKYLRLIIVRGKK